MQGVTFGVGFAPSMAAAQVIEAGQLAETLGYDTFWVTDSHMGAREAYTMLGALAVSTRRLMLGTGVTHLAGRHPSVIASAFATVDDLAPGRAKIGIGIGDSGPKGLGLARASLRELEAAIVLIRGLMSGETVKTETGELRATFRPTANPVPIYIAASSERVQKLAGRVADGALLSVAPDELPAAIAVVRAAEREAGRAEGSTRIMLWTTVCVDADREKARATVRGAVARRAQNVLTQAARRGQIAAEDRETLEQLERAQDAHHLSPSEALEFVPDRWIDRFAIAGTAAEVQTRLCRAVENGAQEIATILLGPRPNDRGSAEQLRTFAEQVMVPLRAASPAGVGG